MLFLGIVIPPVDRAQCANPKFDNKYFGLRSSFQAPKPTRQKNVRQKNEEDRRILYFSVSYFFCLVAETMIKAMLRLAA
jgi:hypothetical protein